MKNCMMSIDAILNASGWVPLIHLRHLCIQPAKDRYIAKCPTEAILPAIDAITKNCLNGNEYAGNYKGGCIIDHT